MALKRFDLPVIVTENGTAETKDSLYEEYLTTHLKSLAKAYSQGLDIRGYLWWSLLDNFEWDEGFKYRFGLVEVDYNTMARKIRPFAHTYAKICQENKIDI
jgi:beta-glucosidase